MSRKIIVLAVSAITALAAMALPAMASATTPEVDFTAALPLKATGVGGASRLVTKNNPEVTCTSVHITVEWTTATTGDLHTLFTGCESSGFKCNSAGLGSGEITSGPSVFHLTYIKPFGKTTPGVLVTPPSGGVFADFHCTFLVHVVVTGNGIIGHIDSPGCGGKSASSTISFEGKSTTEAWVQKYQEDESLAGTWHLLAEVNGGAPEEAAEWATGTTTLPGGAEGTLTCP